MSCRATADAIRGLCLSLVVSVVVASSLSAQATELEVRFVGNAGVVLSDDITTLLIDLPYESGAFGYMRYDPDSLVPAGDAVSVITHEHRDHFDRGRVSDLGWRVMGGDAVLDGLGDRALRADSVQLGAFSVVAVTTPHTPSHRSYRVGWHGRMLYFVGDTEDIRAATSQRPLDVLFITPWLSCGVEEAGRSIEAGRTIVYHQNPEGSDRICLDAEEMRQGEWFTLAPDAGGNG